MKIGIVTGASSGIGKEFVHQIAKEDPQMDELWVVARNGAKLRELQKEIPLKIRVFPLDLLEPVSFTEIQSALEQEHPQVQILVNASGFGKFGNFEDLTQQEIQQMIDLDGKSLVMMTKIVLPYCVKGSRILQISSASAFQPIAGFGVYGAVKSFVLSFSRSLHRELRDKGITVTAVCPYWVKTNFIQTAQETGNPNTVTRFPFALEADTVVRKALRDSRRGKDVSTCRVSTVMKYTGKLFPHRWIMTVWDKIRM